ncbi:KCNH6, partial [Symbiodinium sp. CCMP2592]
LERENALLRCGGPPNPLDKEIEDIMGKVDNFTELGMAKLGAAPVTVGRGQPTLPKKTAEPFQRELTLPTLQGDSSEPASSIVSRAESPRSDMLPQSPAAESEQLDSLQRITLRKRSTLHDFSIMKVQTVNPTQPSAVKPWYVINPARCPMGGAWQILVCASLIFVALVTPVQVCLLQVRYNAAFFVSVLVDFIFFIDMMLQFCTAYTRNTPSGVVLEVRLNKIVSRYVKTWFVLDFVTLIPFDVFAPAETETTSGYSSVKVLRALRLLKLIRLARRSLWMEEQEALRSIPYQQLALGRFLLVLGLMCHWLACLWALTLQLVEDKYPQWIDDIQESDLEHFGVDTRDSPYRVYVASFFFCAYTVTSVGYGDIAPQNLLERVVGSVVVLISGLAWAYIIGEVGAIVDDLTHESQEFRQRMHRLNTMMGDQGLEPDLQCRLRRYFLQNRHQSVFKERQALMERMSPQLRAEACIAINGVWLQKVPFFKQFISHIKRLEQQDRYTGPEEACVADISKKLQLQAFAQEESFDNMQVLFILSRGMLAVFCHKSHIFTDDHSRKYGFKAPGEVWGEDFVLSDVSLIRTQTGYALTYCEVLSLTHHDFMQVLQRRRQSCPELWDIVRRYTIWLAARRGIFAEARRRIRQRQKKSERAEKAARNSTSSTK